MAATAPPSAMLRESLQLLGRAAQRARVPAGELESTLLRMASRAAPALQRLPVMPVALTDSKPVTGRQPFFPHLPLSFNLGTPLPNAGIFQPKTRSQTQPTARAQSGAASCPSCRSPHTTIPHLRAFHSSPSFQVRHKAGSGSQPATPDFNRTAKRLSRGGQVATSAVAGSASALDVNIQATVLVEETVDIDDELDVRNCALLASAYYRVCNCSNILAIRLIDAGPWICGVCEV